MFTLDPNLSYSMPAHFGPRTSARQSSGWYRDVTAITLPFVTEREAIAQYLPAPFQVDENPIVTVVYACNKKVDWLAGHGYNLIEVNTAVTFTGEKEQLRGNYKLVVWENLTDPILSGRELQGVPKLYASIPDHSIEDGIWSVSASHFDNPIVDLRVQDLRPPTQAEIDSALSQAEHSNHPMGWRYLPGVAGIGTSVNQLTTFPSENVIEQAWVASGSVDWHQLSWEQNPTQHHIVNALAALPVVQWLPALVSKGSTNLVLAAQPTREIG